MVLEGILQKQPRGSWTAKDTVEATCPLCQFTAKEVHRLGDEGVLTGAKRRLFDQHHRENPDCAGRLDFVHRNSILQR